jgi:hypothetical protein
MKLSNQALGALMLALQKSLLEQSDIVPTLQGFEFEEKNGELVVLNPPMVNFEHLQEEDEEGEELEEQLELFKK